jgi:hypothetical protein
MYMRHRAAGILSALIICLCLAAPALAQGPMGNWLDPTLGDMKTVLRYQGEYSPDQKVEGQSSDLGYSSHGLNWSTPIWQNSRHEVGFHGRLFAMDVRTEAILPDSGRDFPGNLYDIRFGGTYRYKMDRGWIVGGELTIGSPGDKPFNSYDDTSVNATATLMTVQQKKHYWLFLINYSNTRDFLADIPIPGAAYAYKPNRNLQLLLGLPLASVFWKPTPKTTLRGLYVFPRTIISYAGYSLLKWMEVYTGFDWKYQRYFLHQRSDSKDRLFFYQKEIKLGLKFRLPKGFMVDLSGGYAFDRLWFEGNDWDDRDQDRVNVEDGPLFRLSVAWRF